MHIKNIETICKIKNINPKEALNLLEEEIINPIEVLECENQIDYKDSFFGFPLGIEYLYIDEEFNVYMVDNENIWIIGTYDPQ